MALDVKNPEMILTIIETEFKDATLNKTLLFI